MNGLHATRYQLREKGGRLIGRLHRLDFVGSTEDEIGQAHCRRIRREFAVEQLLRDKAAIIVFDGGAYGVVARETRLDEYEPTLGATPRPARHLCHQLERALRRTEVGKIEPDVSVNNSDERHVREVEPLGDHLCTEEDVDFATGDAIENVGVSPACGRGIDVHTRHTRRRQMVEQEALHLLSAESTFAYRRTAALHARQTNRLGVAAVVTRQALGRAMDRERNRAVRTGGHVAAGAALDKGGESAPVQQQDGLLAPSDGVAQGPIQRFREHPAEWIHCNRGTLHAHVDDLHLGHRATADTFRKCQEPIRLTLRIGPALERWSRGAENHDPALGLRAHDGNVASVITRCFALLVTRLVLLVDDDGAEVGEGGEDRGSRADYDASVAGADGSKGIEPLTI